MKPSAAEAASTCHPFFGGHCALVVGEPGSQRGGVLHSLICAMWTQQGTAEM